MLSATTILYRAGGEDAGLLADVDWATGTIRMHVTYDEWIRTSERAAERAQRLSDF